MRRVNMKKKFLVGFEVLFSYLGQKSGSQVFVRYLDQYVLRLDRMK